MQSPKSALYTIFFTYITLYTIFWDYFGEISRRRRKILYNAKQLKKTLIKSKHQNPSTELKLLLEDFLSVKSVSFEF